MTILDCGLVDKQLIQKLMMPTLGVHCEYFNRNYRPHPKDGGRYCFQFVSSHLDRRGVPHLTDGGGRGLPHPRSGEGCTLSQVQRGVPCCKSGWGVPHSRSGWGYLVPSPDGGGGVPHPADEWVPPSQVWTGGVPHPADGGWYPSKIRIGGPQGTPPVQDWMGYPLPSRLGGVTPPSPCQETDQHYEHLLHSGRCASFVHAGGLSRYL